VFYPILLFPLLSHPKLLPLWSVTDGQHHGRVNFLILLRRLAGGKNITEESLCFRSYVGSYAKMSQPTVLGVGDKVSRCDGVLLFWSMETQKE
jgi:hypothetical protein